MKSWMEDALFFCFSAFFSPMFVTLKLEMRISRLVENAWSWLLLPSTALIRLLQMHLCWTWLGELNMFLCVVEEGAWSSRNVGLLLLLLLFFQLLSLFSSSWKWLLKTSFRSSKFFLQILQILQILSFWIIKSRRISELAISPRANYVYRRFQTSERQNAGTCGGKRRVEAWK